MSIFGKIKELFVTATPKRTIALIVVLLLVIALPVVIIALNTNTENRQHAAFLTGNSPDCAAKSGNGVTYECANNGDCSSQNDLPSGLPSDTWNYNCRTAQFPAGVCCKVKPVVSCSSPNVCRTDCNNGYIPADPSKTYTCTNNGECCQKAPTSTTTTTATAVQTAPAAPQPASSNLAGSGTQTSTADCAPGYGVCVNAVPGTCPTGFSSTGHSPDTGYCATGTFANTDKVCCTPNNGTPPAPTCGPSTQTYVNSTCTSGTQYDYYKCSNGSGNPYIYSSKTCSNGCSSAGDVCNGSTQPAANSCDFSANPPLKYQNIAVHQGVNCPTPNSYLTCDSSGKQTDSNSCQSGQACVDGKGCQGGTPPGGSPPGGTCTNPTTTQYTECETGVSNACTAQGVPVGYVSLVTQKTDCNGNKSWMCTNTGQACNTSTGTPISNGQHTLLTLSIQLPGIPTTNDSGQLQAPQHSTRKVHVELFDKGFTVTTTSAPQFDIPAGAGTTISYDPNTGFFTASSTQPLDLGTTIPTGDYQVFVKIDGYLRRQVLAPSGQTFRLTQGQTNSLPQIALIPGDIAPIYNQLDAIDYNGLRDCYGSTSTSIKSSCANFALADLNDDGKVDGIDINILLIGLRMLLVDQASSNNNGDGPLGQ